jgi:hypothetical protein
MNRMRAAEDPVSAPRAGILSNARPNDPRHAKNQIDT